jgi:phage/plasmid-associated DNA primase
MQAEAKYKQPVSFTPQAFTLITSNTLWDVKNSTTGLARRIIYFPFDNVPKLKDMDLFHILPNGEVIGSLVPHLGGFINWVLTCPKENLDLLYQGGAYITQLISPDSVHVNPLHVFIKDCLLPNKDSKIKLGYRDTSGGEGTLYLAYTRWCDMNGVIPMSFKSFTILIFDLLKQQGWDISKKRLASGLIINGIELNQDWTCEVLKTLTGDQKSMESSLEYKDREPINLASVTNEDFE